jgi:hypothetical protein
MHTPIPFPQNPALLNPPLLGTIDDASNPTSGGVTGLGLNNNPGVNGSSIGRPGVAGNSQNDDGVQGLTHVANKSGVAGFNVSSGPGVGGFSKAGAGVVGQSETGIGVVGTGGQLAARFEGDVEVTGDIRLVNADCAEDFDVHDAETNEPGTVMVLGHGGALAQSYKAYDKRVAGVVSGAGGYKPGIVLDKQKSHKTRVPIALVGKVYCKVDAQYSAIEVGDLLTTSPTVGHAMKAHDPIKSFGAVIGKALRPLAVGQGLIPVLVALQ